MIFGYVEFSVIGDSYIRFYNQIMTEKLPCRKLSEDKGVLKFRISVEYAERIRNLCKELHLECEIKEKKGIFTVVKRFKKHIGVLSGVILAVVGCFILSNFVLKVNILCDDNTIKKDIVAVLKENNASVGSYIPNLNFVVLERELKQKIDGISWAGISVSGSTLTVDIVENIPKPESRKTRLPSNLIAKKDAVIDKIEVFDGQLMTTVGSAVLKGEILVSGTVVNEKISYKDGKEVKDVHTKYVRSLADIYGTFEETVTIFQPFKNVKKVVSDKAVNKRYLKVFDAKIPLFISFPKGEYISKSEYNSFSAFGFDFPFGIEKASLNAYHYEESVLSEEEALKEAYNKLEKYEKNFFSDYEIKNKETNEEITDDGVKIIVSYTLYGNISEENEFFIEK